MRVIYLHGFASSPQSSKAQFFARQLRASGVSVEIPRLDGGDFEHLTITSQLEVVDRAVAGQPAVLFGSSLGGYLAALYAARNPMIEKLVLLAPGFQFPSRWKQRYTPEELAEWKRKNAAPVFHYGYAEERMLGYQLLEDSALYEEEPEFSQPALIFHGRRDDVVPSEFSASYAARHPNVTLYLYDSGHELTDAVDAMWERAKPFLGLP